MRPDYLLLGHITRDVLPDGRMIPGGTSLYAAITAYRLGLRVGVVSAPAPLPADWPDGIMLVLQPDLTPPIFENRYTPHGRQQVLHSASGAIAFEQIPPEWRAASLVHLGPLVGEAPEAFVYAFPAALIGVTPQGWMRSWDTALPGPVSYRLWRPAPDLLARIDALVLSIEDVRGDEELVADYARHCQCVALTRGARGVTLFVQGAAHEIAAFPAFEHAPTGAGDVFAAAFLARLRETSDPFEAARFGACVAARSVEGAGVSAIPTRSEVEQLLAGKR